MKNIIKSLIAAASIIMMALAILTPTRVNADDDCGIKADGLYHCGSNCGIKADGKFHCGHDCGYKSDGKFHCIGDGIKAR